MKTDPPEPFWKQKLRERDARAKLRQKEHADKTRAAKYSNIEEGDKVLLKQTRESKLSPSYEAEPYVVTHKEGNVVILQDVNGNSKMRNIAHMKNFIEPGQAKQDQLPPQPTPLVEKQPVQIAEGPPTQPCDPPSSPLSSDPHTPQPVRTRQAPAWMQDCVCDFVHVV